MQSRVLHLLFASACFFGCSAHEHPATLQDSDASAVAITAPPPRQCIDDAGSAAPLPDAQGLCGNTFLKATEDPPNIYFVIDRSGSMHDWVDGQEKYTAVATASVKLVQSLGAQVNVGAAVFPGHLVNVDHPCVAGEEVFKTTLGDNARPGTCDPTPVTTAFSRAVILPSGAIPTGSTPTAATLTALLPILTALPGKTSVILATDGGPNCNSAANCGAAKCIPNIEKECIAQGVCCDTTINCCDPKLFGPESCLDEEPTHRAVADLLQRGIKTYVVGVPGSSPYATLLDGLALAGGTSRAGGTGYYDVQHVADLDDVLASIGATVILSCHVHLETPPPDLGFVNVYLDRQRLKLGSPDGWVWASADNAAEGGIEASTSAVGDDAAADGDAASQPDVEPQDEAASSSRQDLDIVGAACDSLRSGKIRQVQVTFGCATDIVN